MNSGLRSSSWRRGLREWTRGQELVKIEVDRSRNRPVDKGRRPNSLHHATWTWSWRVNRGVEIAELNPPPMTRSENSTHTTGIPNVRAMMSP